MRRMRNRILLSGVAALLSAAVVAGPAAASTYGDHRPSPCYTKCGSGWFDRDLIDLNLVLKLCLSIL
jgi:hypothetical protein